MKLVSTFALIAGLALAGQSAAQGPEVGSQAPDFELKDSQGNAFRLSDYKGKKAVVLEFFRSGSW